LLGRSPWISGQLIRQLPRGRKASFNLKDEEARLLEVVARLPLVWFAAVSDIFVMEDIWRNH
jgi:hypothetical protein